MPGETTRARLNALALSKTGVARYQWRDPYHLFLSLPWPQFFAAVFALYIALNLCFAFVYFLQPGSIANARPWSFTDAFFFSTETLATVGYGVMAPASLFGHIVVSIELITGMAFTAIMTGLFFVRFSRPRANFLYADQAVVTTFNGRPTLMIRIANGRMSMMMDASARLTILLLEQTSEGQSFRRVHELKLARSRNPLLALTWTLMHDIDEQSPLRGCTATTITQSEMRLFLSVEARDQALAASVYDIHTYGPDEILYGKRYADTITRGEGGTPVADLTRLSAVEEG